MGAEVYNIAELKKLQEAWQGQSKTTNATNSQQWQPVVPQPNVIPTPWIQKFAAGALGGLGAATPRPKLSDFDIELMAACIANKHPVVDGQSHCFCILKRLERGISKD